MRGLFGVRIERFFTLVSQCLDLIIQPLHRAFVSQEQLSMPHDDLVELFAEPVLELELKLQLFDSFLQAIYRLIQSCDSSRAVTMF